MNDACKFAEDVTVTQLSHAAKARTIVLRWSWMILVIAGVAFSIYQTVVLLQMFFSYPTAIQVVVGYSDMRDTGGRMRFPAVTICNKDPYSRSAFSNYTQTKQDTNEATFDAQWDMLQITRLQQMSKNNIEVPVYQAGKRKRREIDTNESCVQQCDEKDIMVRQLLSMVIVRMMPAYLANFEVLQCCQNDSSEIEITEHPNRGNIDDERKPQTTKYLYLQTPSFRQKRNIPQTTAASCVPRTNCDNMTQETSARFIRQIWLKIKSRLLSRKRRTAKVDYCPCNVTNTTTATTTTTPSPQMCQATLKKTCPPIGNVATTTSSSKKSTMIASLSSSATVTTTNKQTLKTQSTFKNLSPTILTLQSTTPSIKSTRTTSKLTTTSSTRISFAVPTMNGLSINYSIPTILPLFTLPKQFTLPSGLSNNDSILVNNVPNNTFNGLNQSDILNSLNQSGISINVLNNLNQSLLLNYTLNNTIFASNFTSVNWNGTNVNETINIPSNISYPKYVYIMENLLQQNLTFVDILNQMTTLVQDYLKLNETFNISQYLPPGLDLDAIVNLVTQMPVDEILNAMKNDRDKIVEFNENNKKTFGIDDNLNNKLFAAQCLKQIIPYALEVVPEYLLMKLGYQYSTLFSRCAFEEKSCDIANDFYPFLNRVMGNCWTFNHKNATNNNHTVQRSGLHHGLSLFLTVAQNTFMGSAVDAGVKVLITDQDESIFPDTEGIVVPIGYTVDFSISMVSIKRASIPYGNCIQNTDPNVYFYEGKYSNEGCFRSCYQKGIFDACGCYDPTLAVPQLTNMEYRMCNATPDCTIDFDCVKSFTDNKEKFMESCDCQSSCNEIYYTYTKSIARRPKRVMRHYDVAEMKEPNVIVNVYFRTMTYISYEEYPDYTLVSFFSDLGGVLGNNLGFSFITCFEMIFLAILIIKPCFVSCNVSRRYMW